MNRMKGRTALITGGSRGIGRAIAERFVSEGANVAINYMSNADAATEVAEAAAEHGVEARIYQANAGVEADCVRLANEVMRDFQQVDVLVNNAGLGSAVINQPYIADASNEQSGETLGIQELVHETLVRIGEDPDREGLVDTPARVARMYAELFSGLL